jgi:hypothetical protein
MLRPSISVRDNLPLTLHPPFSALLVIEMESPPLQFLSPLPLNKNIYLQIMASKIAVK